MIGLYRSLKDSPREPLCSGVRPLRSCPAQKARPEPVIKKQRMLLSPSASFRASWNSPFMFGVKAFRA
jgi:hypothetical protein